MKWFLALFHCWCLPVADGIKLVLLAALLEAGLEK